jgi:hypothetical protein
VFPFQRGRLILLGFHVSGAFALHSLCRALCLTPVIPAPALQTPSPEFKPQDPLNDKKKETVWGVTLTKKRKILLSE